MSWRQRGQASRRVQHYATVVHPAAYASPEGARGAAPRRGSVRAREIHRSMGAPFTWGGGRGGAGGHGVLCGVVKAS